MFVREFGWGRLVLGLALSLFFFSASARAQFMGDSGNPGISDDCRDCHPANYDSYIKHGHATKVIRTGGTNPPMDLGRNQPLQYPWGQVAAIPAGAAAAGVTWEDVEFIMRGSSGEGSFRFFGRHRTPEEVALGKINYDGKQISDTTGAPSGSGYSCGKCHTTGFTDYPPIGDPPVTDPDPNHHQWGLPFARGVWALEGIQCEACHGAGWTMVTPGIHIPGAEVCEKCHTGDKWELADVNNPDRKPQIPFNATTFGFTTHHPQGDEFMRSPHRDAMVDPATGFSPGCALCHDPHKSVFHQAEHEVGGVKFAEKHGVGNMCKECHKKHVRGAMGDLGLECIDCHMAPVGGGRVNEAGSAHAPTHLFKINNTELAAVDNTVDGTDASNNAAMTWWKTDENGNSFLTLDLACKHCHEKMTLAQMAASAAGIHRQPGMCDLTVNGGDTLRMVSKSTLVSVDFSIEAGDKKDMKANWWVICQGPKGWSSWNGKKWVRGFKPWRKGVALADVPEQNVLNSKLRPGHYAYWIAVEPTDGSEYYDSVPLYVKKR